MATKMRAPEKAGTGSTGSGTGLIIRAIKRDSRVNEQVEYLLQQFGEFYFGVERIEDLGAQDRRGWIKFSTSVGKAHHNLAELAEVLEHAIESELDADLKLIQAEIEALERRQDEEAARAARDQKRKETREKAAEKRKEAAFREYLADRRQARRLRLASHKQEMSERETRRKTYRLREGVVIGLTAVSGVLAILLTLIAVIHNEPIFLGGSGVSATLTIGGFIKLLLNGDHSASSASKGKEDRPGQAGPGEGTDP